MSPLAAGGPRSVPPSEDDGERPDIGADEESDDEDEPREAKPRTGSLKRNLIKNIDNINIARDLDQQTLDDIGMAVVREFDLDLESRSEWADKAAKAMRFATQESMPKEYPWPGASSVIFPLISSAGIEFGSRTYPAVIQNRNVVKGVVWGDDKGVPATVDGKPDGQPKMQPAPTAPGQPPGPPQPVWITKPGEKRERADRIGEHMSWQLLEEMKEWEPQTDQLLHQIPVIGGAARKTYYEPAEKRNYSLFVSLMELVWDYHAASFGSAPRHSERLKLYPHQITEYENTGLESDDDNAEGMFLRLDYGPAPTVESQSDVRSDEGTQDPADPDAPHLFIEQHRRWDLDGDGYSEPYVITVHHSSEKVVRIVARYDADGITEVRKGGDIQRIEPVEHYTLIPFLPSIDGGSYPMGFGHLLRPLNEAINSTLNQMFDAGHLQNAGGGFISNDLNIPSGDVRFKVGHYIRVNSKGMSIRESVFPLPFNGPSPVLFQLLGVLMTAGKELASIQNILTGDAGIANAPPTTVLALIEQGMKVHNAIQKRVYLALKSEFQKLYRLNRLYLKEKQRYRIGDEWREITPDDYRLGGGVEPIADPSMTTDMQRLGRAQIILATCGGDPQFDQKEVKTRVLEGANIDRIQDLFAPPDPNVAIMAQMAMAKAQAELGRERAAEQKDLTQAFLNMSLARKNATAGQEAQIDAQLEYFRLRIEAINSTVRAAAVDHAFHATNLEHARGMAKQAAEDAAAAVEAGGSAPPPYTPPTPGPTGPFPMETGNVPAAPPSAIPPRQPPPSNADLPPLPPPGASPLEGAPGMAPKPPAGGAPALGPSAAPAPMPMGGPGKMP